MNDYASDLSRWIPRLIAVWRRARNRSGGPRDQLTHPELKEVGAAVRQLSLGLTRDRELAGARYMDDPKLLGAYLLFYWPVSYAQARQALGELPTRARTALDLGSGPGPVAVAAMDAGASQVTCADRSKAALELARTLATEADEAMSTREWDPQRSATLPEGKFDLVTMGHVVNELFGKTTDAIPRRVTLLEQVLDRVRPGGSLLILEPALKETSRNLLLIRDALVGKGYGVRAPCLYRGPCPALVKPTDWCHAERPWKMPKLVEDVARAASLHKEALKMSYLVIAPQGEAWAHPPEGRVFRIVSEALEGKGRRRFMGCGPEGRVGLAMQERHQRETNAAFFQLNRGDVVRLTGTQMKGDGLALDETSEVGLLAKAGWAVKPGPKPSEPQEADTHEAQGSAVDSRNEDAH